MRCPLCLNRDISLIEKLNIDKIKTLYKKQLDINIERMTKNKKEINYFLCEECNLKFFDPTIVGDEQFYNDLQKFEWYYSDEKEEFKIATKYIGENKKVLEIGSGKGAFKKYLKSCDYVGLEFSQKAKKMAEKNGIVIKNESIEKHAFENLEKYDVVVSFQVLEHVNGLNSFIKSALKSLKKGGILIFSVPSEDSYVGEITNGILNMPPHHLTRYTDQCLKNLTKYFDVELISLEHEKLQKIHYADYKGNKQMEKYMKSRMLDLSLKRKIIAKIVKKFQKIELDEENLPDGNAVLAVYKKY